MEEVAVSRRSEVREGIRISLPAGLGMFPLGLAFGLLVIQAGLEWWVAPALSIAVYAGSLEFLLVSLIVVSAPLLTVAVTTLLVNFRHVFYAFTFPLKVVRNPIAKLYSAYSLTDEAFAITVAKPDGWTAWRLVSMQIALQIYWVGGGLAGVLIGSLLPAGIEGLDFALCALFITLTLDASRTKKEVPSLLLAASCYAFAAVAFPQAAMFAGLSLFVAVLFIRYVIERARGKAGA